MSERSKRKDKNTAYKLHGNDTEMGDTLNKIIEDRRLCKQKQFDIEIDD